MCSEEFNPVCGKDGNTYGNPCKAECERVEVEKDGPCDNPDCLCATVFEPGAHSRVAGIRGGRVCSVVQYGKSRRGEWERLQLIVDDQHETYQRSPASG